MGSLELFQRFKKEEQRRVAEERFYEWRGIAKIPLRELKKLTDLFPTSAIPALVQEHERINT